MKRYMPEMTNLQVREYMEGGGRTVLVPVGSTEDHGDHGPLWTDVYIPLEVCKRAAEELDALVGPPVPFGLAPDHRGASGIIYVRLATFVAMLRDICVSLAEAGFERIALVNGHYVNTTAMQYAAAEMFDDLPRGVRVFPFAYWQGLQPEQAEAYLSGSAGLHANIGETSAVLCFRALSRTAPGLPSVLPAKPMADEKTGSSAGIPRPQATDPSSPPEIARWPDDVLAARSG